MQPFRDEEEAAKLRAAAEEAAARDRAELGEITSPLLPPPRPPSPPRERGTWLGIVAVMVLITISVARVVGSCHRVTHAEHAAMTKLVTYKAIASEQHGPVPFDTTGCELTVQGHFGVFRKCDVALVCSNKTVFHNPDMDDCSRNAAGAPTRFDHNGFTFDLESRFARITGAPRGERYVVLFKLE
jgi:hypothetical protein